MAKRAPMRCSDQRGYTHVPRNHGFTHDPIAKGLLRTAPPIVFLTSINGLLTVVDGILLGAFAGPPALAAVTLRFPVPMLLLALSTMVSLGMASSLARQLGAGKLPVSLWTDVQDEVGSGQSAYG